MRMFDRLFYAYNAYRGECASSFPNRNDFVSLSHSWVANDQVSYGDTDLWIAYSWKTLHGGGISSMGPNAIRSSIWIDPERFNVWELAKRERDRRIERQSNLLHKAIRECIDQISAPALGDTARRLSFEIVKRKHLLKVLKNEERDAVLVRWGTAGRKHLPDLERSIRMSDDEPYRPERTTHTILMEFDL